MIKQISKGNKHENYELLNLLGYGLAKFDNELIKQFSFTTKQAFFDYFVALGIVKTASVVKNRMDLFDPYFNNSRKGWWQKAEVYRHRKILIDSLFGDENVEEYANIIKMILTDQYNAKELLASIKPITKTKFKKLQQTGFEAEQYFISNFSEILEFRNASITDARLFGDGYDFQIDVDGKSLLAEVKGIRKTHGRFRMTRNEYFKAKEYRNEYYVVLVMNMEQNPTFKIYSNPIASLSFKETTHALKDITEFQVVTEIYL